MDQEVFVGRERELANLERRLVRARNGSGSFVLVDGEAGIGKTAFADWVLRRGREVGAATAWGSCWEGEGAPPYWPWLQVLRALGLSSEGLSGPTAAEDEGSRFRLFGEIVQLLREFAEPNGLLVVLDDLHAADVPSLRLTQVLASELGDSSILVLGLRRSGTPELPAELSAVVRERTTAQLTLTGLPTEQLSGLIARSSSLVGQTSGGRNGSPGRRVPAPLGRTHRALPGLPEVPEEDGTPHPRDAPTTNRRLELQPYVVTVQRCQLVGASRYGRVRQPIGKPLGAQPCPRPTP